MVGGAVKNVGSGVERLFCPQMQASWDLLSRFDEEESEALKEYAFALEDLLGSGPKGPCPVSENEVTEQVLCVAGAQPVSSKVPNDTSPGASNDTSD
jgi:hypothetical protein